MFQVFHLSLKLFHFVREMGVVWQVLYRQAQTEAQLIDSGCKGFIVKSLIFIHFSS